MRIVMIVNPDAGRGRAAVVAARLRGVIEESGRSVQELRTGPGREPVTTADVADADAAVVVGGDGTIHSLADVLITSGTPVYHAPVGTENLFARQFGMNTHPETLRRALDRRAEAWVDAAACNGRTFVLMGGVGFDAAVIGRLAEARNGNITHLSYARPILSQLMAMPRHVMSVTVDGRRVVDSRSGMVIVANSRQYAMRLDPAIGASMSDALLDAVFFPFRSRTALLAWLVGTRLRLHTRRGSLVYARGASIVVESNEGPSPLQFDGEAAGTGERFEFHVRPGALRVLAPVDVCLASPNRLDRIGGQDERGAGRAAPGLSPTPAVRAAPDPFVAAGVATAESAMSAAAASS